MDGKTKIELTETEEQIIQAIRELRPFQKLLISKDKGGRADTYCLHSERDIIIGVGYKKLYEVDKIKK